MTAERGGWECCWVAAGAERIRREPTVGSS